MYESEQTARRWDWDDLRFILAVARAGTLSGAARMLNTSHPTVFRRIAAIERRLGRTLFERRRTGYLPTQEGTVAIAAAESIAAEIGDLDLALGDSARTGLADTIRISSSDTVYFFVTAPMLGRFRARHPRVRIELSIGNAIADLAGNDADVAFRATPRTAANLHGVKLSHLKLAVHCHRDHPAAAAKPFAGRDHDWVGLDETMTLTGMARMMRENRLEDRVVFRVNTLMAACEAVRQNIGIGLLPVYVGQSANELVRLEAPQYEVDSELWLVSTPAAQRRPAIRAFFDFMQAEFARLQSRFAS